MFVLSLKWEHFVMYKSHLHKVDMSKGVGSAGPLGVVILALQCFLGRSFRIMGRRCSFLKRGHHFFHHWVL